MIEKVKSRKKKSEKMKHNNDLFELNNNLWLEIYDKDKK